MRNAEVAQIFKGIAQILEIKGGNPFRIRAYNKAAQNIEGLTQDVEELLKEGKLEDIPGIGPDLAAKIKEIVQTGRLKFYQELKKSVPDSLVQLLSLPGVGPKTAKLLYEKLRIKDIDSLKKAVEAGKLRGLVGIKEKTEKNILRAIELVKKGKERMPLSMAWAIAQEFIDTLKALSEVKQIAPAGSLRRMKETVRDIDILVISQDHQKVMDVFRNHPQVKRVLASGPTKSSVLTKDDVQVDLRVVEAESFPAALMYFTGSKAHNIKIRQIALRKGLKINEYGVFKGARLIPRKTEQDIYELLGLDYIPPEMREDAGEIELAKTKRLPRLVELSDIKGDLHVHSKYSDGGHPIREIALAAKKKGYEFIAITDHSQSLKVAGGLTIEELKRQRKEIEELNREFSGLIRILWGAEVDVKTDGSLDYDDSVLSQMDIVIAAIHSGFRQPRDVLTRRIVSACKNKHVDIIAHPTGRLSSVREAYDLDLNQIMKVARDTGTCLEINAFPQRLDLNDMNCRRAKEMGLVLAIGTDAHTVAQLDTMSLGVSLARRGWLEKKDILNTLSAQEILKRLKR
jgi:DNA polymerase (family 10)